MGDAANQMRGDARSLDACLVFVRRRLRAAMSPENVLTVRRQLGFLGRLQKAPHLSNEQVGAGVHRGMSLPWHDHDAAVRQSLSQRLAGRLEGLAAVAALEI